MHAHATSLHYQELDRLGDEIAELSAHLDAATARLLDLIREFDELGGWKGHCASCAQWLAWRAGIDAGTARERVRVARALGCLPHLVRAFARGELSYKDPLQGDKPCTESFAHLDGRMDDDVYVIDFNALAAKLPQKM